MQKCDTFIELSPLIDYLPYLNSIFKCSNLFFNSWTKYLIFYVILIFKMSFVFRFLKYLLFLNLNYFLKFCLNLILKSLSNGPVNSCFATFLLHWVRWLNPTISDLIFSCVFLFLLICLFWRKKHVLWVIEFPQLSHIGICQNCQAFLILDQLFPWMFWFGIFTSKELE